MLPPTFAPPALPTSFFCSCMSPSCTYCYSFPVLRALIISFYPSTPHHSLHSSFSFLLLLLCFPFLPLFLLSLFYLSTSPFSIYLLSFHVSFSPLIVQFPILSLSPVSFICLFPTQSFFSLSSSCSTLEKERSVCVGDNVLSVCVNAGVIKPFSNTEEISGLKLDERLSFPQFFVFPSSPSVFLSPVDI